MRILSGIKPTGNLTLGNYIGALKHFKDFQKDNECFIFVADLHALTLPIDPEVLRNNSKEIAAFYLASGLDPKQCCLFLQSDVPAHAEANAILQNYLYMGELKRMTQFKDKSKSMNEEGIGLGLFSYPVLMAADILLYDANLVPVGEDQTQHVELARDLVKRFNKRYKDDVLVMPRASVSKVGKRIMSLSDPTRKMSKSDPKGDIFLKDDMNAIRKKIMSAVTDSDTVIKYDEENKPGISNLLTIYAAIKEISIEQAEEECKSLRYGEFKKLVADTVIAELEPFQKRFYEILNSGEVEKVLNESAIKAREISNKTLLKIKKAVGLYCEK